MAFNPNLLVKLEPSSLFTQPATIPAVMPQQYAPQMWTYQAGSDTTAMVQEEGYFVYFADWTNTLIYNNGQFLQPGDLIYCVCSDSTFYLKVLTVGRVITTVPYGVNSISVPLTFTQIRGMYAAPVQLIASPGPNTAILVKSATIEVVYGGAQYTNGGVVALQYGSTVHGAGTAASATIAAATVNAWAANAMITIAGALANTASANVVNQGIYLSNQTAAFATGTSVFTVNIDYSVILTTA